MDRLGDGIKITRVLDAVVAGQTAQNGDGVDNAGFTGVMYIAAFGVLTATAVTGIKVQQSDDNGVGDAWSDVAGTAVAIADDEDDGLLTIDIIRPTKQWTRCVVTRGTANAVINGVIALQYGPRKRPTTHDVASVKAQKSKDDPFEGTP